MIAAFDFAAPWWLLVALLGPALLLFERARDRARAALQRELLGPRAAVAPRPRTRVAVPGAAALVAVALAGPRWGEPQAQTAPRGLDLIVCLDLSHSMLARDATPNRLAAARAMAVALAQRARGDRLALVAFAGVARLVVPLTGDATSFVQLLDATDELSVARGGTDIAAAIGAAQAALVGSDGGAVLLLTDGDDPEGRGAAAARTCAQQGVAVHVVALGSVRGAKVAVAGAGGETFLRDADGREVVAAADRAALRAIAAAGDGAFADGDARGDAALVELYEQQILPAAHLRLVAGGELAPPLRRPWFALPALLLLSAHWWPRRRGAIAG